MAGRGATGVRRLLPKTGRAWAFWVAGLVTFFVLDLLALLGSDLALDLVIYLSGALVGLAAARLVTYPLRRRGRAGIWRIAGPFAGLASIFVIIFGGTALAGIPPFPTAEGGNVGTLIYGFALGFGIGAVNGGNSAESRIPAPNDRSELKVLAVILSAVVALFGLLFVLYLLLEYALVPLIKALAA